MPGDSVTDDIMRRGLEKALKAWAQYHELDMAGGCVLIYLGDPKVSVQYIGPNRVTTVDLIEWVQIVAAELQGSELRIDKL